MRQDRSTPITETAEEPTGCGPDGYGGFASPSKRSRSSPISPNKRGASLGPAPGAAVPLSHDSIVCQCAPSDGSLLQSFLMAITDPRLFSRP
jgi:hypothetical protein